jgi:hypothetical protein
MTIDAAGAELLDKEAIRGLIDTYSRAIDRHDPDLLRSIYHLDATDDHGRFVGTADEFARYAMGRMDAEFECTYHAMQHYHRPARRRSPRRDLHVRHSHQPGRHRAPDHRRPRLQLIDRMEGRGGEWRIARRTVVRDWRTRNPLNDPAGADEFKRGRPGRDDPRLYIARDVRHRRKHVDAADAVSKHHRQGRNCAASG